MAVISMVLLGDEQIPREPVGDRVESRRESPEQWVQEIHRGRIVRVPVPHGSGRADSSVGAADENGEPQPDSRESVAIIDRSTLDQARRHELERLERDIITASDRVKSAADLQSPLAEADALQHLALLEACKKAAVESDFLLFEPGTPTPAWVEGGRIVQGATIEIPGRSAPVVSYYVLLYEDYPGLQDAVDCRNAVSQDELASAIAEFNALPQEERQGWVERDDAAREELQRLRAAGRGHEFDVHAISPRGWLPPGRIDRATWLMTRR